MSAVFSLRAVIGTLFGASMAFGCESAETKACVSEYGSAQETVRNVQAKVSESVSASLSAVEAALATCRAANRHEEVDQLLRARNELTAQLGALERRAQRKKVKPPDAEELRRLQREGDSRCPRGQAYRHAETEIRCTGPQLAELSMADAQAYFEERDYRVRPASPSTLLAERGSERYTFVYSDTKAAPRCVILVPAPGIPWQEALARATGAPPGKLKNPGTLRVAQGVLPYQVDEKSVTIRLGECQNAG